MMQRKITAIGGSIDAVKNDVSRMRIDIETEVKPKINLLYEGHADIMEKLIPRSRVDELENKVVLLESIIRNIIEDIQKLQKAQ